MFTQKKFEDLKCNPPSVQQYTQCTYTKCSVVLSFNSYLGWFGFVGINRKMCNPPDMVYSLCLSINIMYKYIRECIRARLIVIRTPII